MAKRTEKEILADLVEAVKEYNRLRDEEWYFADEHGDTAFWDADTDKEHEELLGDIYESRKRVHGLLVEATGDKTLEF